jgi:hypothetical protein
MSITKDLLPLGFSFIALGLSIYNFIRSLIETRMKYESDYNMHRFGIDHELALFEARVFIKKGEAQQLRREGKRAGVQQVVDAAENIEKKYLKCELEAVDEIRSQLKNIPERTLAENSLFFLTHFATSSRVHTPNLRYITLK